MTTTAESSYKKARNAALGALARRHRGEYRRYFAAATAKDAEPGTQAARSRARRAARRELSRAHPGDYARLLSKAQREGRACQDLPSARLAVHFWDLVDDKATPVAVINRFLDRRHAALTGRPVPPIPDKDRPHLERNARVIGLEAQSA